MEQQVDNVAGLDVHRDSVVACARLGRGERPRVMKHSFKTTTAQVAELARWLADLGVTRVVWVDRVYWKPIYYGLEGLFPELWLVNAHHVKNVPGRKTDMADAEWLADVAAHGMVRPSVVPLLRPGSSRTHPLPEVASRPAGSGDPAAGQGTARRRHQALFGGLDRHGQVGPGYGRGPDRRRAGPRCAGRVGHGQACGPRFPRLEEALVGRFSAHHGAVPGPS